MPNISQRGSNTYTSPIRKLFKFAEGAKKKGRKVYHLNIGQPDLPTPQEALEKLQGQHIEVLAYSPSRGMLSLREKLTGYYQKYGIELEAEHISITNGASEGIYFTLLSCLDAGDEIIIPEPFYANYIGFGELAGVSVRPITCDIETGFALPSVADFEAAITPRTRAILLCNPSNPTGCAYGETDLRQLAELVKKHDLYLIVDEVYREFCYGETTFFSALCIAGLEENVIVIDSISKRYSACGARVGMMLTRNEALATAINSFADIRLSPPSLGQLLTEHLLDLPDSYFEEAKATYQRRRDTLYRRLEAMPGVTSYLPGGAFYCFARLPIDNADRFCRWLLEDFSFENQTVMLAPGSGFYFSEGMGKNEVRIAYVLNEADLERAMDCLENALVTYRAEVLEAVAMA